MMAFAKYFEQIGALGKVAAGLREAEAAGREGQEVAAPPATETPAGYRAPFPPGRLEWSGRGS